ncbi:LysR family transcriptional regulator [Radicibacter daui]|uniref:LysR family transcriptional regulator n=1 Tax=Radicibacter daui TaxID=3064829 RepID=UPI004046E89D
MDRLTGLAVLVAAVDEGSLAAAARRLGMTPAMAGKHLATLETLLGARLLQRTTRKLHLTEAGRDYYERSVHILTCLEDADRAAAALQEKPRGILRLTAPTTFGALHLGGPIAEYLRRYPDVRVEMNLDDRFADLIDAGFDLAIRIGSLPDSTLIARRFAESPMMACAAPSYLAGKETPRTPAALARLDCLAFSRARSPGDWSFADKTGRPQKVEGPARFMADNMETLLAAALAGGGILYGPAFVLGAHVARGALVQLLPDYTTESLGIHAVYPSARHVGTKVRHFIDLLEEWFGANPRW